MTLDNMRGSAKRVGYSTERLEALAVEKLACEPGMYGDGLAACEPLQRRRLAHPAVSPAGTARTFFPRACYPFATDSLEQT
jgi:hypothetical protein